VGNWLVVAAVVLMAGSTGAKAQMKSLSAIDVASVARTRTLDLRLGPQFGTETHVPLVASMLLRQDVTPNAAFGVGLANIYSKRRLSQRPDDPPASSRKPAVTFLLKF
jgi:hypothetical protein